jgi:hypothetical protein
VVGSRRKRPSYVTVVGRRKKSPSGVTMSGRLDRVPGISTHNLFLVSPKMVIKRYFKEAN